MRLDKFLANMGFGSRKEVKELLKKSVVCVNDVRIKDGKFSVAETEDDITINGEKIQFEEFFYYLLNKPQNVISATTDKKEKTVIDCLSKEDFRKDLFPVGRLDKDTTGLLLITNNGELAHNLLSPQKHVEKEYYARVSGIVTEETVKEFARGLHLNEEEVAKPGKLIICNVDTEKAESEIRLIIHEGKFHQVKRMFHRVKMEVLTLKRLRMGSLVLDESLKEGQYRKLTEEEIEKLT